MDSAWLNWKALYKNEISCVDMKWKKIGKIFDPGQHKLSNDCFGFAQSPQALVFDEFVRVYFSARKKEENSNKVSSHISFVDFTKDFKTVIQVSQQTVIEPGNLGCYDEHGIFPLNICRTNDNRVLGYIGGWNRRVSVPVDGAIGLSISDNNGNTFKRIGDGPVLAASFNEPFLVADPFVKHIDNVYYMWYIYGSKWIKSSHDALPERVYKIAQATSTNGVDWKRNGKFIIADKLNENECQALPTVVKTGQRYHMYFCYRQALDFRQSKNNSYKLGYAYSDDLINWSRNDEGAGIEPGMEGEWDSDMMCYPHLFECDGKVYLLYNGNEFGKYGFGIAMLEQ